jgi:hypothetical protein
LRVLQANETMDAIGMTIEECSGYALDANWQYFGVENGVSCYMGNSLHNNSAALVAQDQCNIPCVGSPNGELCGGRSQLEMYQDSSWSFPTVGQLITELTAYNSALADAQSVLVQYQTDLQTYQSDLAAEEERSSPNSKSRRQIGATLTPTLLSDITKLNADFSLLELIQQSIIDNPKILLRLVQISQALDYTFSGAELTADDLESITDAGEFYRSITFHFLILITCIRTNANSHLLQPARWRPLLLRL